MKLKTLSKKIPTNENGIFYKEIINENNKIVDKVFIIRYRVDNKDKLLTIGKYSAGIRIAFCKQKRDEIITKIRLGEDIPIKHKKKNIFSLDDAFKPYLEWVKVHKKTYKHNDEQPYYKHIQPHLGTRELISLTANDFEKLKKLKLEEKNPKTEKPLSPKTVQMILALARQIINYAINNNLVKNYSNPIANGRVKMPKVDNAKVGYFTREQAKKLLDKLEQRKQPLAYNLTMILLYTGARFSEVTNLKWYDVNFETRLIFFNTSKDGEPRHIYIGDTLLELLLSLKKKSKSKNDYVVPATNGKQILQMPRQWQLIVDEIVANNKTAGKYRLTVHSLRHTHASWLAISGMNILEIKEQLGHKKLDMTLRYSHLIPSQRHKQTEVVFNEI
jgi:integrase